MIYKVSYVVVGGGHPGAIFNQDTVPRLGEVVEIGGEQFKVEQVTDLIPPQEDFAYLHVAVRPLKAKRRWHPLEALLKRLRPRK